MCWRSNRCVSALRGDGSASLVAFRHSAQSLATVIQLSGARRGSSPRTSKTSSTRNHLIARTPVEAARREVSPSGDTDIKPNTRRSIRSTGVTGHMSSVPKLACHNHHLHVIKSQRNPEICARFLALHVSECRAWSWGCRRGHGRHE